MANQHQPEPEGAQEAAIWPAVFVVAVGVMLATFGVVVHEAWMVILGAVVAVGGLVALPLVIGWGRQRDQR